MFLGKISRTISLNRKLILQLLEFKDQCNSFSFLEEEIQLFFVKEGLGHWISKIKEVMNISNLKLLQTISEDVRDKVLDLSQTPVENRALRKALQFVTGKAEHPKDELVVPDDQNQVGFEGNIWMSAITDRMSRKDKELLQTVDETEFQLFLKRANYPELNSVLTAAFTEITRKFKGQVREQERNMTDEERNITEEICFLHLWYG